MAAEVKAPPLREFPSPPPIAPGAMEKARPFVANEKIQQAIGFPGELTDGWEQRAIAHMGEMLGKYRSLKVFMDSCVHCGACSDKCHYYIGTQDPKKMGDMLNNTYVNYHGGPDGLDELKAAVKSSPLPPANFTIESSTKVSERKEKEFESKYPQLAMWLKIKGGLARAEGPAYFENQLKNAAVPKAALRAAMSSSSQRREFRTAVYARISVTLHATSTSRRSAGVRMSPSSM